MNVYEIPTFTQTFSKIWAISDEVGDLLTHLLCSRASNEALCTITKPESFYFLIQRKRIFKRIAFCLSSFLQMSWPSRNLVSFGASTMIQPRLILPNIGPQPFGFVFVLLDKWSTPDALVQVYHRYHIYSCSHGHLHNTFFTSVRT